jgi:hypothetical protein
LNLRLLTGHTVGTQTVRLSSILLPTSMAVAFAPVASLEHA